MMLKCLAIVVLLASILPIYGEEKGAQTKGNQSTANDAEKGSPPSRTATCVVKNEGTTIECNWTENEPESYLKRLISPENAPNIALSLVGLGGIIIALCTLWKIERQTKATENQVKASHDGLRAWLGIEVSENIPISETISIQTIQQNATLTPQPPRFTWKLKNSGQTPAFITKVGFDAVYQDTMMLYTLPIPKMHERFDFIGTGKERENALRNGSFMYREVITKAKYWRVIFKIEYRDVFDQERVHETVASFHYYVPAGEGDPIRAGFYQEHDRATNYNT
jgi:hypothetical protein